MRASPASSRSPLRQALAERVAVRADALQAKRDAAKELAAFEEALSETRSIWSAASSVVEKAESDLTEALRSAAGNQATVDANAIRHGQPLPKAFIADAKIKLATAKENLRLGNQRLEEVEARCIIADQDFERADRMALEAIYAIERESLPSLIADAMQVQDDLIRQRNLIRQLCRSVEGMNHQMPSGEQSLRAAARRLLNDPRLSGWDGDGDAAAIAPWLNTREALLADPDTPLPTEKARDP